MWEKTIQFIGSNWLDLSLILVGASALAVYWLQERRKVSEAALLIVLQVEDLQKRIAEISTFIVNGQLNDGAFYESELLFKTDYWNEYKHYFIRKMDAFSFNAFDSFYSCASEILEQQQFMKNLQKNSLFLTQQMLMQMETNAMMQSLSCCEQNPLDMSALGAALESSIPKDMEPTQRKAIENMFIQFGASNPNADMNTFWQIYGKKKNVLHAVINQNGLTHYIPLQIRITLENALKKHKTIQIIGCEGYRKLKKIGQRKF